MGTPSTILVVVTTLVLTPRFTDDSQLLWRAAGRIGWKVERLQTWRIPDHLRDLEDPVLYAEALFGPTLAEQLGLQIENPPEDWLPSLPERYRKRSVTLSTLAQARLGTEAAFIKPPNDKSFPARVYQPSELPEGYDEGMSVLISEIVSWETEFRCFVLDRVLQTFSIYARLGELQSEHGYEHSESEEQGLRQFVSDFLTDSSVPLPKATVIDVGWIAGKGWAVVEQNAAWGAGIYACDPEQCLKVIRHASWRVGKKCLVRPAVASEQKQLEALQWRASLNNPGDREALLAHPDAIELPLEQIRNGGVFVAEIAGATMGFAAILPREDGDFELDALFVEPSAWRQGIGRALVEHCAVEAMAMGAESLHVLGNPHAESFYNACGFNTLGRKETRFGTGLVMKRVLR